MGDEKKLSFGEKAVGLTFNHGEGQVHDHINSAKVICAGAIDMMDMIRQRSSPTGIYDLGPSGERIALATIAIRKLQDAQMAMVKAITWKD